MLKRIVILALMVLAVPLVQSQNNGEVGSGADGLTTTCVPTRELSAIAGIITATDLNVCNSLPAYVHRSALDSNGATTGFATVQGVVNVAGPNIPTGGVAAYTYGIAGLVGCSAGGSGQQDDVLAAGSGSTFFYTLDLTGDYCHGRVTVTVTAGVAPVTIGRFQFAIDIRAEQQFDDTLSVVNSGTLDITDRLCAASALGASCTTPTLNVAQSGTWTVNAVNSGGQTITMSGTLDVLDRLCASSAFGATCTTPTLNVAVTSWPTLNIGSMPTLNIAGSLTTSIASWPGLSVGITSIPNLNVDSFPTLTVNDNVHILDSAVLHHVLDSGNLTLNGITINQTVGAMNLTIPRELIITLCGPNFINTSVCETPEFKTDSTVSVQAPNISPFVILAGIAFVLLLMGGFFADSVFKFISGILFLLAAVMIWRVGAAMGFNGNTYVGLGIGLFAIGVYAWATMYLDWKKKKASVS